MTTGSLTFFCGKMGSGKSTTARALADERNAVLISEDEWLAAHYPEEIRSFDDYLKFARRIRPFVRSHVQHILASGSDVVMDFPANTAAQRAWFVRLCADLGCDHELVFIDCSDSQCLERIAKRRVEQPERAGFDTEAVFRHVTQFFEPPGDDESVNVVEVTDSE